MDVTIMSQMKTKSLIVLIIYLNIYCTVWAQTTNNEPSTQLPGNTEPLTRHEIIGTPKIGDNQTEYETTTTTIQSNDFISKNMSTTDTTTVSEKSIVVTQSTTQLINIETTTNNSPTQHQNQTQNIDFGNSRSIPPINESEEQQTTVLSTTYASIVSTNESNDNINSTSNQLYVKSSKALNFSDETNESFNTISGNESHSGVNTEEITIIKTSNVTQESYSSTTESSSTNNYSESNNSSETITTPKMSPNSEPMINSSPLIVETTQFNEINSTQTTETSTHRPSAQTTQQIQTPTINTLIESNSGSKNEESAQITEMPIISTESQTVPNHYILSALVTSDKPIDQNNRTYYTSSTEMPQISNINDSEINNTSIESIVHSNPPEVETPIPNIISSSSEIPKIVNTMETTQTNEQKQKETTETIPQNHTLEPTKESISLSTESLQLTSESIGSTHSETSQTTQLKLSTESPEISSSTIVYTEIIHSKETTQFQSHSTEATVTEKITEKGTQPTQQTQTTEIHRENQNTEPSIGVLATNDSEPSIDSETTFKQPLTDHSLKTTQYIKPITTSIPLESNISTITVTLPNIKYISSISKEDMVNIVTITFIAKSIDIFRWVSIYDQIFRNFTCNKIDIQRNWCTIDRFVYLSPSPLVINNHLILNFFIDDSVENDLNYHVFGGPLIVEALKNSTNSLEAMMGMKVMSLQTNLGTMVVKPLEKDSPERLAKFELLVFIFTVVMFICTVLLCLAIICSCAKRKSVDMNQIQLSNCGRRQTSNGGFDLNSGSDILRDENQEKPLNHNVINLDGWVAPIEQVECEKINKYDNLQDTKL